MNSVFILFVTALCALVLAQSTTELYCPPVSPALGANIICEGSVCADDSTCATGQKCCATSCSLDPHCRPAVNATELQRLCDLKQSQNLRPCVRYVVSSGQCVERNTDAHCNLTVSSATLSTSVTVVAGNCLNGQCVDPCVALNCEAQSTACSVSACVRTATSVSCQAKSVATLSSSGAVITIPCTTSDGTTGTCHDGSCVATVTPCTQACIEGMTCGAAGTCVPRPGVTCDTNGVCTCDCSHLTTLLARTCSDQSTVQPTCSGFLNDCKYIPATCPAPVCVAKRSTACTGFSYTCADASITTTALSAALSAAVCINSDANDLVARCVDAIVINRCQAISTSNGLKVCNWNNDFNLTAIVQHCREQVMQPIPSPGDMVNPIPIVGCASVVDSCMRCLEMSGCQFLPAGSYMESSTTVRLAPRCVSVSADLTNSLYSSASLLPIKDMTSCPLAPVSTVPMSEEVTKIASVNETTLTSAVTASVSTSTMADDPCSQLAGYAVIVLGLSQASMDDSMNNIKLQMIVQFYSLTNVPVDQTKLDALCGCLKKTSTNLLGFQDAFWEKCELASTTVKRSMLQSSSSIYVFNFTSSPVNSSVATAGSTADATSGSAATGSASTSGMSMTTTSGMSMTTGSATSGMSMTTGSATTSGMSMTAKSTSSDSPILFPSAFMAFLGLVLACYCLLV